MQFYDAIEQGLTQQHPIILKVDVVHEQQARVQQYKEQGNQLLATSTLPAEPILSATSSRQEMPHMHPQGAPYMHQWACLYGGQLQEPGSSLREW